MPHASLPLPDELTQVIDAYLDKHNEEGASERLQEELLSIWEKTVEENIISYAPWLAILRRLIPALRNPTYLVQWWDHMTEPVLDHLAQDKSLAKEAWANTLAILTYDGDVQTDQEEGASQIATRLLKMWMQNSQFADHEGNSSGLLKAKVIHGGLLNYGKKRPKVCLKSFKHVINGEKGSGTDICRGRNRCHGLRLGNLTPLHFSLVVSAMSLSFFGEGGGFGNHFPWHFHTAFQTVGMDKG